MYKPTPDYIKQFIIEKYELEIKRKKLLKTLYWLKADDIGEKHWNLLEKKYNKMFEYICVINDILKILTKGEEDDK